jgi:hypothetical protein
MRSESDNRLNGVEGTASSRSLLPPALTKRTRLRSDKRAWLPELAAGLPFSQLYFLGGQTTSVAGDVGEHSEKRASYRSDFITYE